MKKLIALILSIFCIFALVGCAGDNDGNSSTDTPSDGNQNTNDWSIVKNPTCYETGLKQKYENGELIQEDIPMLSHNYGLWTVDTQATCTIDGKEIRQCTNTGCTAKEERKIEAHHVLKDGFKFDVDSHYYECENCTEKIDLVDHEFEIKKQDKYAYFLEANNLYSMVMFKLGYVSELTCEDCDVKILDYKLIKQHYNAMQTTHYDDYVDALGVKTNVYDPIYGVRPGYMPNTIEFEYDANYNVQSMEYNNGTYTYEYDTTSNLKKITIDRSQADDWDGWNYMFDFEYIDGSLSQITFTSAFSLSDAKIQINYEFDAEGTLTKQTRYSHYNATTTKEFDFIYTNGYLSQLIRYNYSSGELISQETTDYTNTYDENGNLISHVSDTRNTTCTYNDANQLTSITVNDQTKFTFDYDNERLSQLAYYSTVYTYEYEGNTVRAYYNSDELVLEIQYLSEYKIVN